MVDRVVGEQRHAGYIQNGIISWALTLEHSFKKG
jgi:hypothetical protein